METYSQFAFRISQGLEWALGTKVFNGGLWNDADGVFPAIVESPVYVKVVRELFKILADVRRRVCFSGSSCDAVPETDSPDMVMPVSEEECYSTAVGCNRPLDIVPLPSQCSADLSAPGTITISRVGSGSLQLSNNPSMPAASFEATATGMGAECKITSYAWTAQLSSAFVGKRATRDEDGNVVVDEDGDIVYVDKRHEFGPHSFAATTTPGPSNPANSWPIPWGSVLAGGDLIVSVTANISFNGAEAGSVTAKTKAEITGNRVALTGLMKQVTGITVEDLAVAWTESRGHYHFDSNGDPVWGHPDGWGIMQLDNIPGFTKTEAHFWNWKTNLQKGMEYIDTMYSDAVRHFNAHYEAPVEGVPDSGWGWNPENADSVPSVKIRIWDDAFSRYNSGNSMYRPNGHDGTKHCERESQYDYIDEKTNETKPDPFMNPKGCSYSTLVRGYISGTPWDTD